MDSQDTVPSTAPDPAAPSPELPSASPDFFEADHADAIDNVVPTRGYATVPVVALGGSAGSIPAIRDFLRSTPASTGMAYVVVIHLAPDHASLLPQLLQQHTSMPVGAVVDGVEIEADHVYVIPPARHLVALEDRLHLQEMVIERGKRVAVDLFFRSLADSHGAHAVAVVLSGADGDGSIGIKRIKERGGLTIAQEPQEAEQPSMPESAIATNMVDWILPVADMPGRIDAYVAGERLLHMPPEDGPQPARAAEPSADKAEALLREVLEFLHARTGCDFTYYKRATIVRRVARRLQVNGLTELGDYLSHLRTHPGEAGALLQDLLISVTNFFRDREAFESVEAHIPELFRHKGQGDVVRVWCAACATGEEVYSMAMLLSEHAETLAHPPKLQVFGCDLDDRAVQIARVGLYPATIAADVSDERLRRFFVKEPGGWRVRRELREMVLFANHDLLRDAPFSRIDLLSCRNLLIYLDREAQTRALEIFNFALRPNGLLFLGASESIEDSSPLFAPVQKKHRIFRQLPLQRSGATLPLRAAENAVQRLIAQHERLKQTTLSVSSRPVVVAADPPPVGPIGAATSRLALRYAGPEIDALHFRMLGQWGPASLIVDARHEVLHVSANAHRFLRIQEGRLTHDLLQLVNPSLRVELHAALLRATETGQPVELWRRRVELPGGPKAVDLRVIPAGEEAPGAAMVMFEAHELDDPARPETPDIGRMLEPPAIVQQLERELTRANRDLQVTVEQYETQAEEFKASNEELQAMNEELRSAGEELETGREELQSVNEELTTLNTEFRNRVEELARVNSDLQNLMSATSIATVFLGRELQVMRYTPAAAPLFNLIPSDIGRPITHLHRQLDYPELQVDADQVLQTLVPVERELREDHHWYLARVQPYRTVDDRIAGVVLTFVDITARRHAEEALRASEARLNAVFDATPAGLALADATGRVLRMNDALGRIWGEPPVPASTAEYAEWKARWADTGEPLDAEEWAMARTLRTGEIIPGDVLEIERFDGGRATIINAAGPIRDDAGAVIGGVVAEIDVTAQWQAERALRESEERQASLLQLADAVRPLTDPLEIERVATRLLGEQLGVHRAVYFEVGADGDTCRVGPTYLRDGQRMPSPVRLSDFGAAVTRRLAGGETIVVDDTRTDEPFGPEMAGRFAALEIGAAIAVPLLKAGGVVAVLTLHQAHARHWTRSEVAVAEAVAERTWAAVARARAEAALRASEVSLRLAIEASDLATWEWDLGSDTSRWNERHFVLLGMPPGSDPVKAAGFFGRIDAEDRERVERELRRAIERREIFQSEFRIVRDDDGATRWMNGYGRVVAEGAGDEPVKMSGVLADITARKKVEQALERSHADLLQALGDTEAARDQAEEAGAVKDRFLALLSHELRTPLTPVMLATQMLMREKSLSAAAVEALEIVRRNVRLEISLVDELLDVTRIASGKLEIEHVPMRLRETLGLAVEVASPDIETRRQRVSVELDPGDDLLQGDSRRLQQAFWNLLKNASKFTPEGGEIGVRLRLAPGRAVVEVRDTGVGFEPGAAERIFRAFEQADRDVTRRFGGLGLGLAIAKANVEAHGGTVSASSQGTGRGATFTVELPLAGTPAGHPTTPAGT